MKYHPESQSQSLYEYIAENCVEGELSIDFSLPKKTEKGKIQFADGAADGIAMYHMRAEMPDSEALDEMASLIDLISDGKMTAADEALTDFVEKHTALSVIDPWQEYVIKNRERLQANNLYRYSVDKLLNSSKINEVKYGMIMLELFTLQDERVKDAVRTVGLSDEFTLFSAFIMRKWENANDEIFRLAKHVHGWGRIHAIERLQKTLSREEFVDIGNILVCMLDEGACEGISVVGDGILETYLEHVQSQNLDFSDYRRIFAFFDYGSENDNHILREKCEKLLHSEECRRLVDQAIELFARKLPLQQMQTGKYFPK